MSAAVENFLNLASTSHRIAAILLLSLLISIPGMTSAQDTNHDVVIVGAGSAGRYAAYTLDNLGFDVLILEANDRLGGRAFNMEQIDPAFWTTGSAIGASYIDGDKNNFFADDAHKTLRSYLM